MVLVNNKYLTDDSVEMLVNYSQVEDRNQGEDLTNFYPPSEQVAGAAPGQ